MHEPVRGLLVEPCKITKAHWKRINSETIQDDAAHVEANMQALDS